MSNRVFRWTLTFYRAAYWSAIVLFFVALYFGSFAWDGLLIWIVTGFAIDWLKGSNFVSEIKTFNGEKMMLDDGTLVEVLTYVARPNKPSYKLTFDNDGFIGSIEGGSPIKYELLTKEKDPEYFL